MNKTCAIILAAGAGKRMAANKPKALCEILFEPMLGWVRRSCVQAKIPDCCVVVGHEKEAVIEYIGNDDVDIAYQNDQKGK